MAFERLAGSGNGVALSVHQPLDLQGQFHLSSAVKTLTGSTFIRLELGKLRFPKTKDVRLDAAQARYVANLEVQPIGDDGRVDHALSG
jgi:hypothetical protein